MENELNKLTFDDFTVLGDMKILEVDEGSNYNLIKKDRRNNFFLTFSEGDDLMTYRGISTNSTMKDVFEKYGAEEILPFDSKNDPILRTVLDNNKNNKDIPENSIDFMGDFKYFHGNERWVEYSYPDYKNKMIYLIRFYFNAYGKVVLVSYFNIDCNFKVIDRRKGIKNTNSFKNNHDLNDFHTQNVTFKFDI